MNKWQRLHVAVLDCVVDNGPLPADRIVEMVYPLDAHFSRPRIATAIDVLHKSHALIGFLKPRDKTQTVIYTANTTQPQRLRAVWRGEPFVVGTPGDDDLCMIPGNESIAQ